jgi:excisionase family DNA binding protein
MGIVLEQLDKMTEAMTVPQVAKLLGIDSATLYRHARSGKLPSFRVVGIIRIDPRDLASCIRESALDTAGDLRLGNL